MMILSDPVGKVLLIVLVHQAFVVHKENVLRNGNGGVFIIHYSCGVEKLYAFFVYLMLTGWFGLHCLLEQAVQLTCADWILGSLADL